MMPGSRYARWFVFILVGVMVLSLVLSTGAFTVFA